MLIKSSRKIYSSFNYFLITSYFIKRFTTMEEKMMKCIYMPQPKKFELKEMPIPKPQSGQVLVKILAAPINPSDLAFFSSKYQTSKPIPSVPGFQGCGLVVENGGGFLGWTLKGKKVAFSVPKAMIGSYSQYTVVDSDKCFAIDQSISFEQGSMSIVNPLTALAFLDILKTKGLKVAINTAAASQLGRMMQRHFQAEGVSLINIVRRAQQVEILKKEGAKYVLNSSEPDFQESLKKLTKQLNCIYAFDALGGKMPGILLRNMPRFATVQVYGGLSVEDINQIGLSDLLFNSKSVKGFILNQWLQKRGTFGSLTTIMKLKSLLKQNLKSEISREFPLEDFTQAVQYYLQNMSKGKVIIKPFMEAKDKQQKMEKKQQVAMKKQQQSAKQQTLAKQQQPKAKQEENEEKLISSNNEQPTQQQQQTKKAE